MFSSIRSLARPLLMFTALVLLIGVLIQPVIPSHAQEGDPLASPTVVPPQGGQPQVTRNPIPDTAENRANEDPQAAVPFGPAEEPLQKPATTSPLHMVDS